ncbi:hypothetical protein [Moritella viscosa]|uniref:Uncharacterized protein n=2 Tax=Moritella viscosa TaxID=80854 RepID=A0A1L0AS82_9GAMM|nr:hypothetical protein [Moritella viscosa]SGZ20729.1 Putative uncharacterized protein [Moritella viscosa]SHO15529.1 Putative uncharacterized protein [Moritella viscosa]SHO17670.1 Putative uncharacterized protein [Moritella viscosa]
MAKAIALHTDVYNLLIVVNINNFTVSEIRDALMHMSEFFNDENETRKYIYRVICKLTKLKLLIKHTHVEVKKSRYTKSEAFTNTSFVMKSNTKMSLVQQSKITQLDDIKTETSTAFNTVLSKEKKDYEAELAVALSEAEEFKDLILRFPKQNNLFKPFYLEIKERSELLAGKINALTKVLSASNLASQSGFNHLTVN